MDTFRHGREKSCFTGSFLYGKGMVTYLPKLFKKHLDNAGKIVYTIRVVAVSDRTAPFQLARET